MNRRIFRQSLLIAALGLAFGAVPAHGQQVIKLTAAAGHPPVFLWVKTVEDTFIPEVDKKLAAGGNKYKIEWTKAWGGTLIKLGSESKGIADGVADLGMVSTVFEAPKFPLQNVSYYTPFGTDSMDLVSKTIGDLQKSVPAMADAWAKNNLVFLGGVSLDTYHIWTTFPLARFEDLKGKKISAPGPSANWIRRTGAVAVSGNAQHLLRGHQVRRVRRRHHLRHRGLGVKLHEVAPYVTRVNFGAQFANALAINKKRFDSLPPERTEDLPGSRRRVRGAVRQGPDCTGEHSASRAWRRRCQDSDLTDAERKRWADALSPVGKIWGAEVQTKGLPAAEVLNGYIDALDKAAPQGAARLGK